MHRCRGRQVTRRKLTRKGVAALGRRCGVNMGGVFTWNIFVDKRRRLCSLTNHNACFKCLIKVKGV